MDYAQIPTNLLIGEYSDAEILAIIKYQLLFSLLENEPTNKNLNKFLTKKQQILVQKYIADIKTYVQNDINSLNKKRDRNARYYRKQKNAENEEEKIKTSYKPSDGLPIEEIEEINNIVDISKTKKFIKPTVEEIKSYCIERQNNIDAQYFYDYYSSKGWLVGKSPMKDWKATIRTWERNDFSNKANNKEENKNNGWNPNL